MSISRYRMILSTALNMRSAKNWGILLVIHMDPVEIHDATVLATKEKVRNVISILDPELSFHDFRMINGAEKKKLIFDLEIPYSYKKKDCDRVIGQIGALDEGNG